MSVPRKKEELRNPPDKIKVPLRSPCFPEQRRTPSLSPNYFCFNARILVAAEAAFYGGNRQGHRAEQPEIHLSPKTSGASCSSMIPLRHRRRRVLMTMTSPRR